MYSCVVEMVGRLPIAAPVRLTKLILSANKNITDGRFEIHSGRVIVRLRYYTRSVFKQCLARRICRNSRPNSSRRPGAFLSRNLLRRFIVRVEFNAANGKRRTVKKFRLFHRSIASAQLSLLYAHCSSCGDVRCFALSAGTDRENTVSLL